MDTRSWWSLFVVFWWFLLGLLDFEPGDEGQADGEDSVNADSERHLDFDIFYL